MTHPIATMPRRFQTSMGLLVVMVLLAMAGQMRPASAERALMEDGHDDHAGHDHGATPSPPNTPRGCPCLCDVQRCLTCSVVPVCDVSHPSPLLPATHRIDLKNCNCIESIPYLPAATYVLACSDVQLITQTAKRRRTVRMPLHTERMDTTTAHTTAALRKTVSSAAIAHACITYICCPSE